MNAEHDLSRWVLVESTPGLRLISPVRLILQRRSDSRAEEILLSGSSAGKIHELIRLPPDITELGWRSLDNTRISDHLLAIRRVSRLERIGYMLVRVLLTFVLFPRRYRLMSGLTLRRALFDLPGAYRLAIEVDSHSWGPAYLHWVECFGRPSEDDALRISAHIGRFPTRPRLHLLVAANNAGTAAVRKTLSSLAGQLYRDFTCIVLDNTGISGAISGCDAELRAAGTGSRIVPQDAMAGWFAAFNSALAGERTGEWVMLLRAGDTLPAHALYWFAYAALERPDAQIVYSDDDILDAAGFRRDPRFKPDWSPAHLRSTHYVGAAAILRGGAVAVAGGVSADCCQHGNFDLLLRICDAAEVSAVHVPAILLHRADPGTGYRVQGAGYVGSELPDTSYKLQATSHIDSATQGSGYKVQDAGYFAWEDPEWCMGKLREHLERMGSPAEVVPTLPGCWRVRYRLPEVPPLISIIVPTRNAVGLLRQCVTSVLDKTTYPRFEILVVDNQSTDPETLAYLEEISGHPAVRVLRYERPFNYSAINNFAAREARGEALCLLNNDTEVIYPDWLEDMAGHLLQKQAGAVGARLLYPDGRVQHAGIVIGPSGSADHPHVQCARDEPGYCNRATLAQEFSAVTGACLLTWKRLYERLGGLNEKDLPVAFNDVDYCLRLQEAGYRVILAAHAELFHHESATRGREDTMRKWIRARRELQYLDARWHGRLKNDPYYNPNFSYRRPGFSLAFSPRVRKPWEK